jgi:hypothetical protein
LGDPLGCHRPTQPVFPQLAELNPGTGRCDYLGLYRLRDQDLATVTGRAQSRRTGQRWAKKVTAASLGFADVYANADLQSVDHTPVGGGQSDQSSLGGVDSRNRGWEGGQHSMTGVAKDPPVLGLNSLSNDSVMGGEDLGHPLGVRVPEFRRAFDVRGQEGQSLGDGPARPPEQ